MRLEVRFDNLEEVKRAYDPLVVEKAARETIKQLHGLAATQVSKKVREVYNVKARDISKALKKKVVSEGGIPSGYLIYLGRRLSLRYFSTSTGAGAPSRNARPKVKSRAGDRRGARVRIRKTSRASVLKRAFWGRGRAGLADGGGEWQIFQRIGLSRHPIKKLTGPSIAHMVRSNEAVEAINELVRDQADKKLAHNLDHFMQKHIGIR